MEKGRHNTSSSLIIIFFELKHKGLTDFLLDFFFEMTPRFARFINNALYKIHICIFNISDIIDRGVPAYPRKLTQYLEVLVQ